jgi:hypothetical protein
MTEDEQKTILAQVGFAIGQVIDLAPWLFVGGVPGMIGAAGQMGLVGGAEQLREAEAAGRPEVGGKAFAGGAVTSAAFGALPFHLLGKTAGILGKAAIGAGAFPVAGEAQEAVKQFIARELYNPTASYDPSAERIIAGAIAGGAMGGVTGMFMRHGEKPPLGADPNVDKIHKAQADEAADVFDEFRKKLKATATAQRSPEAIENFIRQHPGRVGITQDAMRMLYEPGKAPQPGDGLLGDVPGVVEGFPSGKEIWVDRGDLLTRAKEEVVNEIADDLVHTEDGISKNEGKELPEGQLELPLNASPTAQVLGATERAAGIHPVGAAVSGLPRTTEELVYTALTKPQRKLLEAAEADSAADVRFESKKAEDAIRKRQTQQWTTEAKAMQQEVRDAVGLRSDVAATEFLEEGKIQGRRIDRAPRLKTDDLTPEQQTVLAGLHSKTGKYTADGLARIFNYPDGPSMLRDIAEVMELRRQHGVGRDQWISDLVKNEIEARLEAKYGPLEGNIILEARQHVVSDTKIKRIYAEYENLGTEHGMDPDESHDSIKARAEATSQGALMEEHTSKGHLKQAGKYGREMEQALIDGKPFEAMKAKLNHIFQLEMANQAAKVESRLNKFERNMKTQSKREWAGAQEFRDFIHDIMFKIGRQPDRTPEDLVKSITDRGASKTLKDFTLYVNAAGGSMPVWDHLFQPEPFGKNPTIGEMQVQDFLRLHNSIETMIHNGRLIQQFWDGHNASEFKLALQNAIQSLQGIRAKVVQYNVDKTGFTKQWWQALHAGLITVESFVKRIEKGTGPLTRLMDFGAASEGSRKALQRQYRKMFQELEHKNLDQPINNDVIMGVGGQGLMPMMRRNLIIAILRRGDKNAWDKYVKGEADNAGTNDYRAYEARLEAMIDREATKEDYDYANGIVKIEKHFKKNQSDPMELRQSGIALPEEPARPFNTRFGRYEGGHARIFWDQLRRKPGGRDETPQVGPLRAATSDGYTIERTGYTAPMDHNLDMVKVHFDQMIHDVAYREFVAEARKLFDNNDFQNAVTHQMGPRYGAMLKQWVKDVADQRNVNSQNVAFGARVIEALRTNLTASLIGWNPGTFLKHSSTALVNSVNKVGGRAFAREFATMFMMDDELGNSGYRFAMASSDFMAGRRQSWSDVIGGMSADALGKTTWRQFISHLGSSPVAFGDMMSAVPTWLAAYKKEMSQLISQGADHTDAHNQAVAEADRAVRDAHGDPSITNRPEYMRQQGLSQWFTSLYGFFNHIFQRHYEMAWRLGEAKDKAMAGDIRGAMGDIPKLTSMFVAYVIAPAAVEQLVEHLGKEPTKEEKKESWGEAVGKGIAGSMASSVPLVRDVAHALIGGHDPSLGLMATEIHSLLGPERDLAKKDALNPKHYGQMIQDTVGLAGALTGFPLQVGRSAKFVTNYVQGRERQAARSPEAFLSGLWHGTAEPPRR